MKFLSLAALALTFAACSSNDDELTAQQPAEQPNNGEITITATIEAGDGAATRALSESGSNIASNYVVGEKIAVLFEYESAQVQRDAEVKSFDGTTATVEFTIPDDLTGSQTATLVYPATAVNAAKTGADVATALATQDGSIDNCPEVRTGTGTLDASAKTLTVSSALAAQNGIFQLTLKDIDGANDVSAASIVISDQTGTVTTFTPASGCDKVMYVALPTTATTLKFLVTGSDSKKYFNMASSLSLGANFYQSTIKLATVGDVILSTGKCAKAGTSGAVAKITYVGSDAETSTTYNHGLALALSDVSSTTKWCSQATATCLGHQYNTSTKFNDLAGIANTDALVSHTDHTHAAASAARNYNSGTHPTGTSEWFLPSAGQWDKMIGAAGLSNLGLQANAYYWSSTERSDYNAWHFHSSNGWDNDTKDSNRRVRACLAF